MARGCTVSYACSRLKPLSMSFVKTRPENGTPYVRSMLRFMFSGNTVRFFTMLPKRFSM
ncbi:hypothetical protein D3C73_1646210 [compost metagenome]